MIRRILVASAIAGLVTLGTVSVASADTQMRPADPANDLLQKALGGLGDSALGGGALSGLSGGALGGLGGGALGGLGGLG
ncbi:hypothetical protein [Streptosporangium sp. KLBMP 9127]|nr:hypothetical protein [Streptosporangium sp. KLBMP 9127]